MMQATPEALPWPAGVGQSCAMGHGKIRAATEADAQSVLAIYAPIVRDTAISFEESPPTVDEIIQRMRSILPTYPYLVFEEDGQVLGYANGHVHRGRPAYRWSVETTIYVREDARGQGVGRSLYARLLDVLTRQGFHTAYAGIAMPNPGSVAVHQAVGFRPLGVFPEVGFKQGRWHDVSWWYRPLNVGVPDGDPLTFAEVMQEA